MNRFAGLNGRLCWNVNTPFTGRPTIWGSCDSRCQSTPVLNVRATPAALDEGEVVAHSRRPAPRGAPPIVRTRTVIRVEVRGAEVELVPPRQLDEVEIVVEERPHALEDVLAHVVDSDLVRGIVADDRGPVSAREVVHVPFDEHVLAQLVLLLPVLPDGRRPLAHPAEAEVVVRRRVVVAPDEAVGGLDRAHVGVVGGQRRRCGREIELDRLVEDVAFQVDEPERPVPHGRTAGAEAEGLLAARRVLLAARLQEGIDRAEALVLPVVEPAPEKVFVPDRVIAFTTTPDDPPNSAVY